MKIKINIGGSQIELEEQSEMLALHKAIILGAPPKYCHVCNNNQIFKLDSNKDKEGNVYVNVVCKCGAKAKLGQYKTGGYFWHKFEVYQKQQQQQQNPHNVQSNSSQFTEVPPDDPMHIDSQQMDQTVPFG
jgi:hypothetical protein